LDFIESKDNKLIKEIKKLKEKKYRQEKGQFLIEGFRFVSEALISEFEVSYIFISSNAHDKLAVYAIDKNIKSNTKIISVSETVLKSICDTEAPQGIAAVVNYRKFNIKDEEGFYVLCDAVQDPGNMGTIIRSAHAGGALGVIITKGTVDIFNQKTLRATMGSIFHVPIIEHCNAIKQLKQNGFKLLVSSLAAENDFYDADLTGRLIISVGNEGNGVSSEVSELADLIVKIPMPGGAESLNVAVASSIMMFERVRQLKLKF
jgi:RNA methyltransferase, TrmH family